MKKTENKVFAVLALITALVIVYCSYLVGSYAGVGAGVGALVVGGVILAVIALLAKKHCKGMIVLVVLYLIVLVIGGALGYKVDQNVGKTETKGEVETVYVAALKDSGISAEDDFSNYRIGYLNGEVDAYKRCSEILKEHDKRVERTVPYKSTKTLHRKLNDGRVDLLLLTGRVADELEEIDEKYMDKLVILFQKTYQLGKVEAKHVNIEKEPFVLYLQGADSSGRKDINSTGRGDANILVAVNPTTKKINMQVVPRDTFVNIPSMGGHSKLSYSGWWGGVQSSIESIEETFDVDINYYAKINWNGVVGLVDALGGVDVYSQYDFYDSDTHYVQGYNHLNGEEALGFVRERKSLPENELSRGKNQMAMIKAILNKFAMNPNFDDAMTAMNAITDSFVTNVPKKDYLKAFNLGLKMMPEIEKLEMKSMDGEFNWKHDEVNGEYKYYFYPAEGEKERVKADIEKIKSGK